MLVLYPATALLSVALLCGLATVMGIIIAQDLGDSLLHLSSTITVVCDYALSPALFVGVVSDEAIAVVGKTRNPGITVRC